MASGRVGGTRSKIRGQVGDVIYQVVKNPDGSYTQISYGKPEDVTQTITPRLQAQRMCTSMVESVMRDLKPIGRISMQSAPNKSKSLNAFSSYNLSLVARDCKNNWYSGNKFYYPATSNVGTPHEELGGAYMLSSGTWQYNGFDELVHLDNPISVWPFAVMRGKRFAGMRFRLSSQPETVDAFLRRHFMSALDVVVFACFHDWQESDPEIDDPIYYTKHSYVIAQVNSAIGSQTQITPDSLRNLFVIESDWEVYQNISDDGRDYYLGFLIDNENENAYFYTYGGFTISRLEGKAKISSSSMQLVDDGIDNYFLGQAPADVMGTWMGEPNVKPYPSPFV